MQCVLQLRRGEWQRPQNRQREAGQRAKACRGAQSPLGQRTQQQGQRQGDSQRPARRAAFMLRQGQESRGQQRPRPAEQAPGEHTVIFSYRPRAFLIGGAISLAALLGVLVCGLWWWRRKSSYVGQ